MIQRLDYIESVATQGSKKFWDAGDRIFYEYFPVLDSVYVEEENESFWYRADSISEAREKHLAQTYKLNICNKRELKVM